MNKEATARSKALKSELKLTNNINNTYVPNMELNTNYTTPDFSDITNVEIKPGVLLSDIEKIEHPINSAMGELYLDPNIEAKDCTAYQLILSRLTHVDSPGKKLREVLISLAA